MLSPAIAKKFQDGAVSMWRQLEDASIVFRVHEPPTVDYADDTETAGESYACRVLPGDPAKEADEGDGVSVGDSSVYVLAVGLSVTPAPGWSLTQDGADQGQFSRVDSDPAGAAHRCWIKRV